MLTLLALHGPRMARGGAPRHMGLRPAEARVIHRTLRNQRNRVPRATHRPWVLPILRLCSCVNRDELSCHLRFLRGRAQTLWNHGCFCLG